jgi:hypothetical protein
MSTTCRPSTLVQRRHRTRSRAGRGSPSTPASERLAHLCSIHPSFLGVRHRVLLEAEVGCTPQSSRPSTLTDPHRRLTGTRPRASSVYPSSRGSAARPSVSVRGTPEFRHQKVRTPYRAVKIQLFRFHIHTLHLLGPGVYDLRRLRTNSMVYFDCDVGGGIRSTAQRSINRMERTRHQHGGRTNGSDSAGTIGRDMRHRSSVIGLCIVGIAMHGVYLVGTAHAGRVCTSCAAFCARRLRVALVRAPWGQRLGAGKRPGLGGAGVSRESLRPPRHPSLHGPPHARAMCSPPAWAVDGVPSGAWWQLGATGLVA